MDLRLALVAIGRRKGALLTESSWQEWAWRCAWFTFRRQAAWQCGDTATGLAVRCMIAKRCQAYCNISCDLGRLACAPIARCRRYEAGGNTRAFGQGERKGVCIDRAQHCTGIFCGGI